MNRRLSPTLNKGMILASFIWDGASHERKNCTSELAFEVNLMQHVVRAQLWFVVLSSGFLQSPDGKLETLRSVHPLHSTTCITLVVAMIFTSLQLKYNGNTQWFVFELFETFFFFLQLAEHNAWSFPHFSKTVNTHQHSRNTQLTTDAAHNQTKHLPSS